LGCLTTTAHIASYTTAELAGKIAQSAKTC
jgi:hypothetical protein